MQIAQYQLSLLSAVYLWTKLWQDTWSHWMICHVFPFSFPLPVSYVVVISLSGLFLGAVFANLLNLFVLQALTLGQQAQGSWDKHQTGRWTWPGPSGLFPLWCCYYELLQKVVPHFSKSVATILTCPLRVTGHVRIPSCCYSSELTWDPHSRTWTNQQ